MRLDVVGPGQDGAGLDAQVSGHEGIGESTELPASRRRWRGATSWSPAASPERQARGTAKAAALRDEVEGLRALRRLAERAQEQKAHGLGIQQPPVQQVELQSDRRIVPTTADYWSPPPLRGRDRVGGSGRRWYCAPGTVWPLVSPHPSLPSRGGSEQAG
jgi:hypothetical protein